MIDFIFIFMGLMLLFFGGDGLVRGSVEISQKLNLSTILISTVIVGFGTSMPELVVSVQAAFDGSSDIALGNIIGSNICNTLLILGIAAIIASISCRSAQIRRDVFAGVLASAFLVLLSFLGVINQFSGLLMLVMLAAYLSYNGLSEKKKRKGGLFDNRKLYENIEKEIVDVEGSSGRVILITVGSLFFLVIGAKLLVTGAISIAYNLNISEAVIALTLIALGTSLPELATACIASWRKHTDVVIGNVLGSNLFNILGVLGFTAVIKPISFSNRITGQGVWIMLAVSILLVPLILSSRKISRAEGTVILSFYFLYIFWLYFWGGVSK